MVWNGNECTKCEGNKNLKGTIPITDYDILHRNCLLKHITEGTIGGGIKLIDKEKYNHFLDDLTETSRYWKIKNNHYTSLCGKHALEVCGPVVRQTTE
jgi:hypothetical protein